MVLLVRHGLRMNECLTTPQHEKQIGYWGSALKELEKEKNVKGLLFGRGCSAANLIYCLSKMRYKQRKGDPKGFKAFLKKEGIKTPRTLCWE